MTNPTVDLSFETVWSLVMRSRRAREWLCDPSPVPLDRCLASLSVRPVLSGYSFIQSPDVPRDYPIPDIGDLYCVLSHDSEVALGVAFDINNREPLLPTAYHLTRDPVYTDARANVRRLAIVVHPLHAADFVRVDFGWAQSGVLCVAYAIYSGASAPDASRTPACGLIRSRLYGPNTAMSLYLASLAPDSRFLDGTTSLLQPSEGFLRLDVYDTRHQTACVFCLSRGLWRCECPMPFRRRQLRQRTQSFIPTEHGSDDPGHPGTLSTVTTMQQAPALFSLSRFGNGIQCNSTVGTLVATWRSVCPKGLSQPVNRVLSSNIVSYGLFHTTGYHANLRIQRMLHALQCDVGSPKARPSLGPCLSSQLSDIRNGVIDDMPIGDLLARCHEDGWMSRDEVSSGLAVSACGMHFTRSSQSAQTGMSKCATPDESVSRPMKPVRVITKRPRTAFHVQSRRALGGAHTLVTSSESCPATYSSKKPAIDDDSSVTRSGNPGRKPRAGTAEIVIPRHMEFAKAPGESHGGGAESLRVRDVSRSEQETPSISAALKQERVGLPIADRGDTETGIQREAESAGNENAAGASRADSVTFNDRAERKAPNLWRCKECGVLIRGKRGNLNRHIANKHDLLRAFECKVPKCGKRFQTRLNLVRHRTTVHDGRPHRCPHCPRAFKAETELETHISSAHSDGSKTMACPVCGRCFGRRSTLNRHTSKVHAQDSSSAEAAGSVR